MSLDNYTFLVVEDSEGLSTLLKEIISLSSHNCICAANGEEALDKLASLHVDAVITDVQMPRVDGITLMGRIHEQHPTIPVAVMSSGLRQEEIVSVISKGAVDFIPKPFRLSQVRLLLEKLIQARFRLIEMYRLKMP